jgi:hypothetical protein
MAMRPALHVGRALLQKHFLVLTMVWAEETQHLEMLSKWGNRTLISSGIENATFRFVAIVGAEGSTSQPGSCTPPPPGENVG